jgi:hypothetical protein
MKKMILSLFITAITGSFVAQAQPSADFQKGTILTAANEKVEGTIKDQTKNKGSIAFVSAAGQKKVYTPAELSGFSLNGANYISYSSDFYKVLIPTGKAALYQRVTDNSGKMLYNGAEVVSVTTAEGKAGDYYIQIASGDKWIWVTQKNFESALSAAFADCATVVADIKSKQIDFTQIAKAVEKYNSCH